jgi:hypothetical protein
MLLAIKEIHVTTTLKFLLTPVRMTVIKNQTTTNSYEDVRKRNLHTLLLGIKTSAITMEISMKAHQKEIKNSPT